jgi:hypothetical protein
MSTKELGLALLCAGLWLWVIYVCRKQWRGESLQLPTRVGAPADLRGAEGIWMTSGYFILAAFFTVLLVGPHLSSSFDADYRSLIIASGMGTLALWLLVYLVARIIRYFAERL